MEPIPLELHCSESRDSVAFSMRLAAPFSYVLHETISTWIVSVCSAQESSELRNVSVIRTAFKGLKKNV
jgi:hypothetical protein